jgi:hypothetical protein
MRSVEMPRAFVIVSMVAALAILLFICQMPLTHADPSAPPDPQTRALRVGVYDSRAVCVASRGSAAITAPIAELQEQLKQAEAAGDTERAAQIKQRGSTLQTLRHLQAFSTAPVDDILAHLEDKLPEIAREAGVDIIVARLDYQGPSVELVDVTDQLVRAFDPDERTIRTVTELRKHKPIDLTAALEIKD